ncbi:cytochrome c-type biogenesis protein CcmH [Crenothrix sp.]|uniref:cytochrome c-type biogenesis protein n=1 Tax=Crenothrix sp. TaxID=3100433 RepID=UPI00374D9DE2
MMLKTLSMMVLLMLSPLANAVDARQMATAELQETYESINSELRCLVCQNQTIADSNAELAGDLRRQVAEMLQQGKSKQDIIDFMTQRYGDFVLYKPPFKGKTSLLWLAPGLFLVVGMVTVFFVVRRRKSASMQPIINDEQQKKISKLLDEGDDF